MIIEQNNLNQVDYDTDMLERVRDECGDYLKSLELDRVDIYQAPEVEMNEGVTDAVHQTVVREMQPSNTKSGLDQNAEKNAKIARLRSGSRTKHQEDGRPVWDIHHQKVPVDSISSLKHKN